MKQPTVRVEVMANLVGVIRMINGNGCQEKEDERVIRGKSTAINHIKTTYNNEVENNVDRVMIVMLSVSTVDQGVATCLQQLQSFTT